MPAVAARLPPDGKKTTYIYDADGNRILENSSSGSVLYLGEAELTTNASGTLTQASRSYAQAGAPTVVRTTTNGSTTGHKLSVLIADHLGTANTSVELSGTQPVTRRAFKPYGEVRGAKPTAWPNKRSYLGVGIDDAGTGLTHIGAREYDQTSGRFLSADPLIDITDPLQMNGYTYSRNSPVSTSDPTGLKPVGACGTSGVCSDGSKEWFTQNSNGTWTQNSLQTTVTSRSDGSTLYTYTRTTGSKKNKTYTTVGNYGIYNGIAPLGENRRKQQAKDLFDFFVFDREEAEACKDDVTAGNCGSLLLELPLFKALKLLKLGKRSDEVAEGASKLPGCKCFLAGTDVLMADGETKDIEDVEVGDEVLATDPETGETGPRKVTHLIRTDGDKYFNELSITTSEGVEKVTATHEHPFWSPSEHDWMPAGQLKRGMTLRTDKGDTVIVTANRPFTKQTRTYNLTVDDLHTYYVLAGTTPVLVHNSDGSVCNIMSAVTDETRNGKGSIVSRHSINADQALEAGIQFLGPGYKEMGKGRGVFRSADGLRQFRIDPDSLDGGHWPHVPHVHFQIFANPGDKKSLVNNHVPLIGD